MAARVNEFILFALTADQDPGTMVDSCRCAETIAFSCVSIGIDCSRPSSEWSIPYRIFRRAAGVVLSIKARGKRIR